MTPDLRASLSRLARHERVVVATDFDGVLAPLVDDPQASRALPGDMEALRAMAARPGVTVALVSGRDLDTLARLTGVDVDAEPIVVIGSHGAQSSRRAPTVLTADQQRALDALEELTGAHVRAHPQARLERKPTARVVHTRGADPDAAHRSTQALLQQAGALPGVHVMTGKDVVELAVVRTDKGSAVQALAAQVGATAVCYLGDDTTDETVFVTLEGDDVGIKVGPGDTAARFRVADPQAVTGVLEALDAALAAR